ncbi:MAG: DUF2232 domain-containing protein [Gemmatimonadota bacterium]|nr:DUF2232 domain-containing protein [Gemmatimonadota bacterium]
MRPPVPGRAILLLAAYVILFPPLFVLGPLAGLLIASRPATVREWAWIAVAALWLAVSLWNPGGLATQTIHAWALFVTGAFVALMLSGRVRLVTGALLATVFGLGAATTWNWWLGTRWQEVQLAVAHSGWEFCRQLLQEGLVQAQRDESLRLFVDLLGDGVAVMAQLLPGMLVLAALPGLVLAWAWYHRIARRPIGPPAGRFAEFRFNDQLIWLVVLCVAALVLPLPARAVDLTGNLAIVIGGLYAARGAAILWGTLDGFPLLVLGVIVAGVIFVLPVVLGGCFALGVADTWVDFRRRLAVADQRRE